MNQGLPSKDDECFGSTKWTRVVHMLEIAALCNQNTHEGDAQETFSWSSDLERPGTPTLCLPDPGTNHARQNQRGPNDWSRS